MWSVLLPGLLFIVAMGFIGWIVGGLAAVEVDRWVPACDVEGCVGEANRIITAPDGQNLAVCRDCKLELTALYGWRL